MKPMGVCLEGRVQDVQTVRWARRCTRGRDGEDAGGAVLTAGRGNRSRDSRSRREGLTLFPVFSERGSLKEELKGSKEPDPGRVGGLWPALPLCRPGAGLRAPLFPGGRVS